MNVGRADAVSISGVSKTYQTKDGMIEASFTSFWFGLTSDIAIRVKKAGKIGARLDIRAKSRTGENDMGMNAALVRDYMNALGR